MPNSSKEYDNTNRNTTINPVRCVEESFVECGFGVYVGLIPKMSLLLVNELHPLLLLDGGGAVQGNFIPAFAQMFKGDWQTLFPGLVGSLARHSCGSACHKPGRWPLGDTTRYYFVHLSNDEQFKGNGFSVDLEILLLVDGLDTY